MEKAKRTYMTWRTHHVSFLRERAADGWSSRQIAEAMGITRNMVIAGARRAGVTLNGDPSWRSPEFVARRTQRLAKERDLMITWLRSAETKAAYYTRRVEELSAKIQGEQS